MPSRDFRLATRNRALSITQQPWNTDHEAQVTMMATEGARAWSLPSNMFIAFSTVCPRESGCHDMDRSAPLQNQRNLKEACPKWQTDARVTVRKLHVSVSGYELI